MDKLYKDLQDKLRSNEELPKDFSWDHLGPSILNEVSETGELTQPTKSGKSDIYKYFAFGILGLFSLLALSYFLFNENPDSDLYKNLQSSSIQINESTSTVSKYNKNEIEENSNFINSSNENKDQIESIETNQELKQQSGSQIQRNDIKFSGNNLETTEETFEENLSKINNTESKIINKKNEVTESNVENVIDQNVQLSEVLKTTKIETSEGRGNMDLQIKSKDQLPMTDLENSDITQNINTTIDTDDKINAVATRESNHELINSNFTEENLENEKIEKQLQVDPLKQLLLISNLKADNVSPRLSQLIPSVSDDDLMIEPVKERKQWSLDAGLGVSYFIPNLSGEDFNTPLRAISEIGLANYHGKLNVNYHLNKRWEISSGISLSKYSSKLDYYDSRDTVVVQNILLKVEVNSLSGNISEVHDDVTLDGIVWDQVTHFNDYKYLTVPLMITKNIPISPNVKFGVGLGLHYAYLYSKTGKGVSLSTNEFTTYKVSNLSVKQLKKSSFGYSTKVDLNFSISKSIQLGLELDANYSATDLDETQEITFRPIRVGSLVKLKYRL